MQQSQPIIAGFEYGPYEYLNYPHNRARERQYSQESLKMQRGGSGGGGSSDGSGSGSSHGHHHYYLNQAASQHGGYQNMPRGAGAPMMHQRGSSSTSSFGSFGTPQGQYSYTSRTGLSTGHHTRQPSSSVGHNSIQIITQPNYTANHASETHFLYDAKNPEQDDYMHNPTQHDAIMERRSCSMVSIRGFCNVIALVLIMLALIGLFGAYPVIQEAYIAQMSYMGSFGLGGELHTPQRSLNMR